MDLKVRHDRQLTAHSLFRRVIPVILRLAFLVYPIVTNVAFEAFSCFEFEDGRSWLRTDVAIECESPAHVDAKQLASIAIVVYPVGLFVLNTALLFRARKALYAGTETALTRSLRFLHAEYGKHIYWWELMEMGRRFVLVSLISYLSVSHCSRSSRFDQTSTSSLFQHTHQPRHRLHRTHRPLRPCPRPSSIPPPFTFAPFHF